MSLALKNHAYDIVSMLIEHGANREIDGQSVFEVGLQEHELEVVKACIDKGEDLNKFINVHFLLYTAKLLIKRHFVFHVRKDHVTLHYIF